MKAPKQSSRPSTSERDKGGSVWEYRVARPLDCAGLDETTWMTGFARELSALGAEGWELCAQTTDGHCVFKRPQ